MEALHEHSPDHACGENELQMPDFSTYQWEWMGNVPGWRDYYLSHDQTPHYAYGRTMLKAIAFQFPNDRRWILKGNQHSEQLPALMSNYPDAFIVQTHRDPLAILQSVLTMRGLSVLANQKKPDIEAHVAYWVDRIERMLRAYIRDYKKIPGQSPRRPAVSGHHRGRHRLGAKGARGGRPARDAREHAGPSGLHGAPSAWPGRPGRL